MDTKVCFKCGERKPLSEFYEHPQMADGHLNKCKDCTKADRVNHEKENPDAILASRLSICAKNPTRYNANRVVEAAVKSGAIKKPDHCFGCGRTSSETRISSHHYDYSKPMEVIWVCAKCHRPLDANRREREGKIPYAKGKGVILVYDGKDICRFTTISEAAKSVGAKPNSISGCLSGKTKTCAGFGWRYEEAGNGA